jgi:hypothetical protein
VFLKCSSSSKAEAIISSNLHNNKKKNEKRKEKQKKTPSVVSLKEVINEKIMNVFEIGMCSSGAVVLGSHAKEMLGRFEKTCPCVVGVIVLHNAEVERKWRLLELGGCKATNEEALSEGVGFRAFLCQ